MIAKGERLQKVVDMALISIILSQFAFLKQMNKQVRLRILYNCVLNLKKSNQKMKLSYFQFLNKAKTTDNLKIYYYYYFHKSIDFNLILTMEFKK